jgi:phosphopantothenate synthetase
LPDVSRAGIWASVVAFVLLRFVDGISRTKKISVTGRGAMLVDINALSSHINTSLKLKSDAILVRNKAYAVDYLQAHYYEDEAELMDWVDTNKVPNCPLVRVVFFPC